MMKAKSSGDPGKAVDKKAEARVVEEDYDDGVVMVLFPMDTWNKVQEIAVKASITPAEVLSAALQELDRVIEEARNGARSG